MGGAREDDGDADLQRALAVSLREQQAQSPSGLAAEARLGGNKPRPKGMSLGKPRGAAGSVRSTSTGSRGSDKSGSLLEVPAVGTGRNVPAAVSPPRPPPPMVDDIFLQFGMNAAPTFGTGSGVNLAGLADEDGGEGGAWEDDDDLLDLSD